MAQQTPDAQWPELSVVLPIFNEAENLEPLLAEIEAALAPLGRRFEIVAVDDKSTDDGLTVLRNLQQSRPWLRVVAHTVNCGQSAAFATGFHHVRGDIAITLDADGQNDPADIPRLLAELKPGIDAVCGIRQKREDSFVRRLSSRIANRYRNMVTGDRVTDAGCAFRAIRRETLAELPVFNGLHRFMPTILRWQGFVIKEIPVNHRPRTRGVSKYGVGNRLWRGIRDCMAMRWYRTRCIRARRTGANDNTGV